MVFEINAVDFKNIRANSCNSRQKKLVASTAIDKLTLRFA
jgi:hypothetical protein